MLSCQPTGKRGGADSREEKGGKHIRRYRVCHRCLISGRHVLVVAAVGSQMFSICTSMFRHGAWTMWGFDSSCLGHALVPSRRAPNDALHPCIDQVDFDSDPSEY